MLGLRPDTVIFDVDGVLVDTEASYGEATVRTVQWCLVRDGVRDDGPAADRATARLWKREGDWNNDWDLSYGLYCWLAAAEGATTTARRHAAVPALEAARSSIADLERRAGPARRHDYDAVRAVFSEIYEGTADAVERYGVDVRVRNMRGLKHDELILLETELLQELVAMGIGKVGILTGRNLAEWTDVRPRLPLGSEISVATDDDGRKPDPAPLRKVVRELCPTAFVAVGDTRADLELVVRWNATDEGRGTPGTPVILCPAEDEPAYRAAGASLFIRSLAELPALLRRASSPPAM